MFKNRLFGLAAVLLAFGLVAAACGDDDAAETTVTTAAAQAEAPVLLDIVDTAVAAGDFGTLATALTAAGLVDTLKGDGPFTVFAPTDAAFDALPEGTLAGLLEDIPALTEILRYHVVAGDVRAETVVGLTSATTVQGSDIAIAVVDGGVVLNGVTNVVATDIEASNGVIHVIDSVLLPPAPEADAMGDMDEGMDEEMLLDIVDTAVAAGGFETLAAALTAANLVDTLKGEGPFTVFAPTDEAFDALPEGTVAGLLEDIPALTDILRYHVIAGAVPAEVVVGLTSATTVQGSDVTIEIVDGDVVLNGEILVTVTDIMASNGIIHVIDGVLLP